jgi:hypothetical protein
VEAYAPDEEVEAARATARRSLIERITRVLLEPDLPRTSAGAPGEPNP